MKVKAFFLILIAIGVATHVKASVTVEQIWQMFERGQVARAESLFTHFPAEEQNTPAYWILQARLAASRFQPEEAIDILEKALQQVGPHADLYFELGNALSLNVAKVSVFKKMGVAKKMKRSWRRAIRLNPKHTRAMLSLAQYYLLAPGFAGGDADSAVYFIQQLERLDPKLAYMGQAIQAQKDKDIPRARALLQKVIQMDSTYSPAYLSLAFTYRREEQSDSALAVLDKLLAIEPDNPFALNQKGQILLEKGKLLAARDLFYQALKSDPYLVAATFYLAQTYEKQESYRKAGELYRQIIDHYPKHPLTKQAKQRLKKLPLK